MYPVPDLSTEFVYKTSRSGGKGGQNVNKVASKVELRFNVRDSMLLTQAQKDIILEKLKDRLIEEKEIRVVCEESRSQLENKDKCRKKLYVILIKALQPVKERKRTKRSKASVEKRLKEKAHRSELKKMRRL